MTFSLSARTCRATECFPRGSAEEAPSLEPNQLIGAHLLRRTVEFAERLVLKTRSRLLAWLRGVTYARVDKLIFEDGEVRGVEFMRVPGARPSDILPVLARNQRSGTLVDELLNKQEQTPAAAWRTKGSTLSLRLFWCAGDCNLCRAQTDQRPFFIIP